MIPELEAETRDDALEEMINKMAAEGYVEKPKNLLQAALSRESIVTTAVEHSLAFPHVRRVEGGGLIRAAGHTKTG